MAWCQHPGQSIPQAQQRYVFWYPPLTSGDRSDATLVWVGNRWQSAPDRLKDHDFETWLPIDFTAANASEPALPQTMQWMDNFTLKSVKNDDTATPAVEH